MSLNSQSDEDLLTLSPSTLTALTSFVNEQEVAKNALLCLSMGSLSESPSSTGNDLTWLISPKLESGLDYIPSTTQSTSKSRGITVEAFKDIFKENWQLSQFWYSQDTAKRLARALINICTQSDHIAFLCCPTGYVAFKESGTAVKLYLFEHDMRFATLAGTDFVPYNLNDPLSFARVEALRNTVDIVVVDPPFHSEESQRNISSTLTHIIRSGGRVVLFTGLTLSPLIDIIYPPPLPKLRRRHFEIEHDGAGRLETPYGCWVGGGDEAQNETEFGSISGDGAG